jgi:hypothetical protein
MKWGKKCDRERRVKERADGERDWTVVNKGEREWTPDTARDASVALRNMRSDTDCVF